MAKGDKKAIPVQTSQDIKMLSDAAMHAAEFFAKNAPISLGSLNKNVKQDTGSYSRYTKEQIMSFMQNPSANAKQLRDASIYMADVSVQYNRLLKYYSDLYRYDYTVAPVGYSGNNAKTIEKSYWDSLALLERLNLPHAASIAVQIALKEGVYYGVIVDGSNAIYIQRINPNYCQLSSIVDGTWLFSVDMSRISENKLFMYPPEFTTMFNKYKAGEGKWQEVPSKICFCIKADESVTTYAIPPFSATLGLLYDIEQYKALQETSTAIDNYKLLHMKIPLNDDGTPKVDWDLAQKYYQQLCNNIAQYIGVAISPMDIDDFSFDKSGTADQVDMVARAEDNYWISNGSSALLHGSSVGKTAGALKLSIKSDETFVWPIVKQIELVVNRMLRDLSSAKQKFKINILPVTVFNYEDMVKFYKEGATLGIPGSRSAYAALLGTAAYDVLGLNTVETNYLKFNDLTPLSSTYTMSGNSDKEAGRPAKDETELGDSGADTRDADSNANR